jgi:hypothetical protein
MRTIIESTLVGLDGVVEAPWKVVSNSLPTDPGWNAEVLREGAAAVADLRRGPAGRWSSTARRG